MDGRPSTVIGSHLGCRRLPLQLIERNVRLERSAYPEYPLLEEPVGMGREDHVLIAALPRQVGNRGRGRFDRSEGKASNFISALAPIPSQLFYYSRYVKQPLSVTSSEPPGNMLYK